MTDARTLRDARLSKGWTLRDAAPRAGIDFTYLSKVENGHERASDALVLRLSALYGIDPEPLLLARAVADVPEPVRDAILLAAAAEADTLRSRLDTEQTISSNYADSLALMVKDHDTLRSRVAALEEAVATFLSIAYPSGTGHPADRAADDLRLALAPTPDR